MTPRILTIADQLLITSPGSRMCTIGMPTAAALVVPANVLLLGA